jgi:hypothetical protein
MKKIYLSIISVLIVVGVNAQVVFGFDYKDNYQNFTHKDQNSAVVIAMYNYNQDSTLQPYSAILSVKDNSTEPSLTATNGIHFNMSAQQKIEFGVGQLGFRNEVLVKIKPILDNYFWGTRMFKLNLSALENFTQSDLLFGHQDFSVLIDYDGSKIGIPRVDKSMFTIYPNPSLDNIFLTGVQCKSIQILDLLGKVVLNQNTTSNQISVETLPAGIYVLNALSDQGLVTQKIVKK